MKPHIDLFSMIFLSNIIEYLGVEYEFAAAFHSHTFSLFLLHFPVSFLRLFLEIEITMTNFCSVSRLCSKWFRLVTVFCREGTRFRCVTDYIVHL